MASAKLVTYFRTKMADKPGAVLGLAQSLKAKNIGLTALWGYGTQGGEAVACCLPKQPDKFRAFLKSSGMSAEEGAGVLLRGADKTGALVKTLKAIADAGVNLEAGIAIAAGEKYGAFLQVGAADIQKVASAIGAK